MTEELEGCTYRENDREPRCRKVCDPGQHLCPYHLVLTQTIQAHADPTEPLKTYQTPKAYTE